MLQACSSYPKCWEVEEEKCSVKYQKICTADLALPELVDPKEQPEKRWKRSVVQKLHKKIQKKSKLVHKLLQKRSVPNLQKLPETVYPEEQQEKRTKRSAVKQLVHALFHKRSVPDLQKLPEPVFPEEQDEKTRTKRFAHHLLKKLVSKKSEDKEKEELCHHVPHKHCVVVSSLIIAHVTHARYSGLFFFVFVVSEY